MYQTEHFYLSQAKLAPKLAQLKALEQKQALLEQGLAQYAENDPERINLLSELRLGHTATTSRLLVMVPL